LLRRKKGDEIMMEEIINASELQILVNILGKEIEITYPLYYFKLLRGMLCCITLINCISFLLLGMEYEKEEMG